MNHIEAGIPDEMLRPLWVEINRSAIAANVRTLQALNADQALMAVVKADGYGHGAVETAQTALQAGVSWLGVALPEEGIVLRQAGITAPILVLGPFYPGTEDAYINWHLTATLATTQAAECLAALAKQGRLVHCHLKVDTGMGRIGCMPNQAVDVAKKAVAAGVQVEGIYTHLATADEADTHFSLEQLGRFHSVLASLDAAGIQMRWRHAGNSAAIMQLPLAGMNLSRAGIALYGLAPSAYLAGKVVLQPAMSWHARVMAVRRMPAGYSISYGACYTTEKETTIAVLPVGYADGYTRRMSHQAKVLINGQVCPVVGTICMDQCMVNVGDMPVQVGDAAVLLGKQGDAQITADDLAHWSGTINYEVVCGIGARVPRVYV